MIDEDEDDADEVQEVPLPNVKSSVLTKVIDFLKHDDAEAMTEIDKPLKSSNMSEVVQSWYAEFVDVDAATDGASTKAASTQLRGTKLARRNARAGKTRIELILLLLQAWSRQARLKSISVLRRSLRHVL